MKKLRKNNKGFSLVELIVVIAIMAVLVGVLAPQFIKYVESSRQSTDMQNVQQLKTAIEVQLTDGSTATAATIATNGTAVTVTIGGTAVTSLDATSIPTLKSSGWPAVTYSYNATTGSWTASDASGTVTTVVNTNQPGKDMYTVFK